MQHWTTIRSFRTARFNVTCDWTYEDCPDVSWADAETLAKLESGEYVNATFRVRVMYDGREIAADYLGNSVYANPSDFAREHIGIKPKCRADGMNYGTYFSGMMHEAISAARKALCNTPRVRCA